MKNKTWRFLNELTIQEKGILFNAINESLLNNQSEDSSTGRNEFQRILSVETNGVNSVEKENLLSVITASRNLPSRSDFQDYLRNVGDAIGCPADRTDIYEYLLLAYIIKDILKKADNPGLNREVSQTLKFSNINTEGLCNEIIARAKTSDLFRRSLPFVLASFLGIDCNSSLSTSINIGALSGSDLFTVSPFAITLFANTGKSDGNNKRNRLDSVRVQYPLTIILILLYQEHEMTFKNPQEASEYVKGLLNSTEFSKTKIDSSLSLLIQIDAIHKKKLTSDLIEIIDRFVLQGRRYDVPHYKLMKLLPYYNKVEELLCNYVCGSYSSSKLDFDTTVNILRTINDKKDWSKLLYKNDKPSKSIAVTDFNQSSYDELRNKIKELEDENSFLKSELKLKELQFRLFRHDYAPMFAEIMEPLYNCFDTDSTIVNLDDVHNSIELYEESRAIVKHLGVDEFGSNSVTTRCLADLVDEIMVCDEYSFRWNNSADKKVEILVAEPEFKHRVLANIKRNFLLHAFSIPPYNLWKKEDKIVEANISEIEQEVVLSISNNGFPISEENIKFIFEDGKCYGPNAHTGHGLSYVNRFMRHNKGCAEAFIPQNDFNITFVLTFKK